MEDPRSTALRIGAWCVNPASGEISREGEAIRLDVRTMRLLLCLAERRGDVVSIDELLKRGWPEVTVSPDSVYQAVASLRRMLGDDPKQPKYIATEPRLGYRMLATVTPWTVPAADAPAVRSVTPAPATTPSASTADPGARAWATWAVGALCLVIAVALLSFRTVVNGHRQASGVVASALRKSIAVMPFVDLTEHMAQEEFADGLTEELIDRLGKFPGYRVPPPTSSFAFKNKKRSVADIAKALDVLYVVDGSTRKSGDRLRVAVRLIRADTGVVVWSESYERRWGDILTVQDDIAGEVTRAVRASIEPGHTNEGSAGNAKR
jgi:TolB-like protein/DNA-binding winged helix-turn-helix (wHTH) protein